MTAMNPMPDLPDSFISILWMGGWAKRKKNVGFAHFLREMVADHCMEQEHPGLIPFLDEIVAFCSYDAPTVEAQPEAMTSAAEKNNICVCCDPSWREGRPLRGRPSISLYTDAAQQEQTDAILTAWLQASYLPDTQQVKVGHKTVPAPIGLAALYYHLIDAHRVSPRENLTAFHGRITALLGHEPCSRRYLSTAFSRVRNCGVDSLRALTLQQVQHYYTKYADPDGSRGSWQGITPREFTTIWEGLYQALSDAIP